MSDSSLRQLERRWNETHSIADQAAYLWAKTRVGDLTPEQLTLAAYCGHEAALETGVEVSVYSVEKSAFRLGRVGLLLILRSLAVAEERFEGGVRGVLLSLESQPNQEELARCALRRFLDTPPVPPVEFVNAVYLVVGGWFSSDAFEAAKCAVSAVDVARACYGRRFAEQLLTPSGRR